LVESFFADVG
jgi:hypothetical protein